MCESGGILMSHLKLGGHSDSHHLTFLGVQSLKCRCVRRWLLWEAQGKTFLAFLSSWGHLHSLARGLLLPQSAWLQPRLQGHAPSVTLTSRLPLPRADPPG